MCVGIIKRNLDTDAKKMLKNRRVLAHYVVCNGRVYANSVLGLDSNGGYQVEPFTHEIASTEFVSGVVAVCDTNADLELIKHQFDNRTNMSDFAQSLVPDCNISNGQYIILKFYSDVKILIAQDV